MKLILGAMLFSLGLLVGVVAGLARPTQPKPFTVAGPDISRMPIACVPYFTNRHADLFLCKLKD